MNNDDDTDGYISAGATCGRLYILAYGLIYLILIIYRSSRWTFNNYYFEYSVYQ
jgi:hypothetical protein